MFVHFATTNIEISPILELKRELKYSADVKEDNSPSGK